MDNRGIADTLRRIAVFSELSGENPFKSRAFENGARAVEKHPESVAQLCAEGRLAEIKGVGRGIAEVIEDVVASGHSRLLDTLTATFPPGITDLLSLSGMGPKRVRAVYGSLGVSTLGELEYACRENRLVSLAGFGEKMQAKVLKAIEFRKTTQSSRLYSEALAIGEELVGLAEASALFGSAEIAGSLRRGKAVFKDIDILLIPKVEVDPAKIQELLLSFADSGPDGPAVIGAGDTKVSIRRQGLQVDFRIIAAESHASALQHFTGSKEHNTLLRSRAKAMGLKMSEYGVFDSSGEVLPSRSESDVYRHVGLAWIPAEIREADGEIEAAEAGSLPALVEPPDIHGMIHVHTSASDGRRSLDELARECIRRGYAYLCVSDHSRTAAYAGGLSIEALAAQAAEIAALNASLAPFRIFHGIESDILSDGALDYPDDVLAKLDFVIGSVHSKLSMDRDSATERLLMAIANPRLTILGHPSGRLLLSREGYPYDETRVLEALAANGVALEHNANPHRLDPDWEVLKRAARRGIRIAIDPDAHDIGGFDDMRFGIAMARKAWLGKGDIVNCMSAEEIGAFFSDRKRR
jgi:DNA polymerase (family 10)